MNTNVSVFRLTLATALAVCLTPPLRAQLGGTATVRGGVPVAVGPFQLITSGGVDRIASPVSPRTALSIQADLRAPIRSGGFWLGTALEGAREIDTIPVRPLLRFGVWQTFNAVQVSIGASSHAARLSTRTLTFSQTDSSRDSTFGSGAHLALWSDVESRLAWRVSRTTFAAMIGARPTVDHYRPSLWGHLDVEYAATSYASLVGAVGTDAPRIALGVPAVHFASLALRLGAWPSSKPAAPAPTLFVVRSAGDRRFAITYQAPNASSVELSGDFDGWKPAAFVEIRPGTWEATIIAPPGTYHVNLRVDGGRWFAPPGLAQTEDDFNGAVGILVLH
jgi:hypothetical protein